jgi:HEPN domain
MNPCIEQVKHNENFLQDLCDKFIDQYFDWKITCLFYVAHHLIKSLSHHWGVNIGNRHSENLKNLNPKNLNRTMKVKSEVFEAYDTLFEYSWTSRYDGFTDFETFQILKKADYEDALKRCEYIKKYVISKGVII